MESCNGVVNGGMSVCVFKTHQGDMTDCYITSVKL